MEIVERVLGRDWKRKGKKGLKHRPLDQDPPILGLKNLSLSFAHKNIVQKKPQEYIIILAILKISHQVVLKISFPHVDLHVSLWRCIEIKTTEPL